ncbi:2,3,4,5-tetrahydropyridine-2,6-dicarboxylate N-acetyltransferase [Labeo rohita]|uniref:2,3,4,5-tetrahydropyridine-2,6-dicarboxylate N-acetyltransferase n=1 Tax=Labeo rohita TaxID=84645 RepID=A0ABQ8M559_LABRO|nr:2,3,4,5-tetrahydropyridine-2,6-dicarboxylate N-acetyltransferase [Labeo rohita]
MTIRDGNRERPLPMVNNVHALESETTNAMSINITSEGQSVITSMIVPVWVSSVKNSSNEQLVYALLDTQSDTTFIDEDISNALQVESHPVKLKLTTLMGDNVIIRSKRVSDLRVRGLTTLGWSIVGCSTPSINESTGFSLRHRMATKEMPALTPMDILESDFKDVTSDDKIVSQEDIMFLDKLKVRIKKNAKGHYEMPLPFKQQPHLPDNRELQRTTVRLNHLNKNFCKHEKYKTDYITYKNDIIDRDTSAPHQDNKRIFCSELVQNFVPSG